MVLRELFATKTQATIAQELTDLGLRADQTKVSAWTRGRHPNLDQIVIIERWAGKPLGWVLARAGYASFPGVDAIPAVDDSFETRLSELAEHVAKLEARITKLERVTG